MKKSGGPQCGLAWRENPPGDRKKLCVYISKVKYIQSLSELCHVRINIQSFVNKQISKQLARSEYFLQF
jgi:hypothetical protein